MGEESSDSFDQEGQFLVHFYLDDGSHQMDASVLHACEGHVLNLFHEVGKLLDVDFKIETRAHPEGGLQVWLTLVGKHAVALGLIASTVAGVLATGKWMIYDRPLTLQQQEINELTLQKMRLELKKMEAEAETKAPDTNATKPLDLEPAPTVSEILPALEEKRKVVRLRSKFYESLMEEQRAHAVGFASLHKPQKGNELVVGRNQFNSFIQGPIDAPPHTYKRVQVEVISPVLTRKQLKWRGIFENEVVRFDITDEDFLSRVANKRIAFQNGTTLVCDLTVSFKENEVGEIIPQAFEVGRIYRHFDNGPKRNGRRSGKKGREEMWAKTEKTKREPTSTMPDSFPLKFSDDQQG